MSQNDTQGLLGLVTFGGDIEGEGFAAYAYRGMQRVAEDRDLPLEVIDTPEEHEVEEAIRDLLERDVAALVTIGLHAGQLVEELADQHPETIFITLNYQPKADADNLSGLPVAMEELQQVAETLAGHLGIQLERDQLGPWQSLRLMFLQWNPQSLLIPVLAIFSALVIGAFVIAGFDSVVWEAFNQGLGAGVAAAWRAVVEAYTALWNGSIGNPVEIWQGLQTWLSTGDGELLVDALSPIMESLRLTTPYVLTGLAVALGFRAGLFNIGAEGQYFIGGLFSVYVGYAVSGLPWFIHLPLALLAGFAGGALWGAIAGFLKAQTGAHEVINTIMLNFIAFRLAEFLLKVGGPMARPNDQRPISPEIFPSARLWQFFPNDPAIRINAGLFVALIMVFATWYLLFKTPIGFELRTVGASPRAARTAGMSIGWNFVLAMGLSGGLAGLAGSHDVLGVLRYMPNAFQSGYGFDAIALALLGKSHPVGVLLASLLFGLLRAGAVQMQGAANVPIDIISVLQGLIIVFVAAPELIRTIYRLRDTGDAGEAVLTRGWGGNV